MASGLIEDAGFPLVVVQWPAEFSDAQLLELLQELASYYGRRHCVLHDGVRVMTLTAPQRRIIAQNTLLYEDEVRRWVAAAAAVTPSALTRGIVSMIQWLAPSPCPFRAFTSRPDAEQWLLQAIRRDNLRAPGAA